MAERRRERGREYLVEIRSVGKAVQVVAIDPITGLEVSMVGDASYGIEYLKRAAGRKLAYVLNKRFAARNDSTGGTSA